MGINASVNFLKSEGRSSMYTDVNNFIKSVAWSLGELNKEEENALRDYYENFSDEEKVKYYSELLSFAGISHRDFQQYLNEHRSSSESWFKAMKRINDSVNK